MTATTSFVHPVFRARKPVQLRIVRRVTPEVYEGRPNQRAHAPVHDGPRYTSPRLRDGAWFGGGGSRQQVLEEVLDFLGEGEDRFESAIRRALR